jgi:MSHA biogenesis protein MshN
MSVLNTMLGDLERRGQGPPLSLAPRDEALAPVPQPAPAVAESAKRRPLARPAVLLAAAAVAAAALWLWPRPAPAPADQRSPPPAQAAAALPAAPLPTAVVEPSASAPGAAAGLPSDSQRADAAELHPALPIAAEAPSQPMHPHTPTAHTRRVATAAAPQTAGLEGRADAGSDPAASALRASQSDLTRAMASIARGRTSEAVQLLEAALSQRPAWSEARSTLAALQAEAGDRQQALDTLRAGVAFDPGRFAPTAAQLQAELGDPLGALQTLDRVAPEARDPTYHALAGAVAQRAGQHERAATEYGAALRFSPSNSLAWVGLAVSLQALGRDAQALSAYRAAAVGKLSPDLQRFVQARIGAMQGSTQAPAADPP